MGNKHIINRSLLWPDLTAGLIALLLTAGGIFSTGHGSWFSVMLLYSVFLSLRRGVLIGLCATVPPAVIAIAYSWKVSGVPFVPEYIFVPLVWLVMVVLTGRLGQLSRKNHELAERHKTLLREVHHRIKNHMNIIRSIVMLERSRSKNPQLAEKLLDLENRIALMQNIYQQLHIDREQRSVNLKAYIEQLCSDLQSALAPDSGIQLVYLIDDLVISAQQALPLGIMVNELVTNCFKYAFTGRENGSITLTMKELSHGKLYLEVADDGVGLCFHSEVPDAFGFGLTLVSGYVQQYGGDLQFDRSVSGGTKISAQIELTGQSEK